MDCPFPCVLQVPFYADEEEAPSTPKADAFFIPRENPRALIIRPIEQWPLRNGAEKQTISRDEATPEKQNGKNAFISAVMNMLIIICHAI